MKDYRVDLAQLSEIDLAYQLLQEKGEPTHYRDLIEQVFSIKSITPSNWAQAVSSIYTQINLDPRFSYAGEGRWGLKSWLPAKNARRLPLAAFLQRTGDFETNYRARKSRIEESFLEGSFESEIASALERTDYYTDDEEEWES